MSETIVRTEFDDDGPLPPGLLVQVAFLSGPLRGKTLKLYKRSTIIGRKKGDIVLNDNAVSGQHAMIGFENGRLFIRDLNSTNGTMLNGGQVWEGFLNSGDEITVGETVMKVEIKQMAASASWADLGLDQAGPAMEPASQEVTQIMKEWEGQDPLSKPLPKGLKLGLQVISGLNAGAKLVVKKRGTLIGRAEGADLELHDMNVSRKHISIEVMGPDRVILKDLRSRNGVFLNDSWVTIGNLKNGDVIRIGNTQIKVFMVVEK
jgi:pSer/pThr/pTyr-binding forkhead associated (FHA) protein